MELLIVAAGNGTRFSDVLPKPLAEIDGVPNVFNTVMKLGQIFSKIIITVSNKHLQIFIDTLKMMYVKFPNEHKSLNKVQLSVIESGKGSGHAVLMSLFKVKYTKGTQTVVTWGDAHFKNRAILDELEKQIPTETMIIPVDNEIDPYLTMDVDQNMNCLNIAFNKKGNGYHDQSIFLLNAKNMIKLLCEYEETILDFDDIKRMRYTTSNGEFGFLYVVEYMAKQGKYAKAYVTNFPIKSYNDVEELKVIRETLN